MRVGSLECFAGISGDMLMAALVDAGAPIAPLQDAARSLGLGAELRVSRSTRISRMKTTAMPNMITMGSTIITTSTAKNPPRAHLNIPRAAAIGGTPMAGRSGKYAAFFSRLRSRNGRGS
jgi:hypothetical protein